VEGHNSPEDGDSWHALTSLQGANTNKKVTILTSVKTSDVASQETQVDRTVMARSVCCCLYVLLSFMINIDVFFQARRTRKKLQYKIRNKINSKILLLAT
jgi:hypothetical protein